ncbi:unnamed protein product [Polarella glacialis]|uniref:Cyclic nucleotide-binding domain-containing protein n=1 Tax=Polarella glacialis TaxID=89957 RepID=A0A813LGB9_POLGL|nr:unnamed protein product [Polarella glacialis]
MLQGEDCNDAAGGSSFRVIEKGSVFIKVEGNMVSRIGQGHYFGEGAISGKAKCTLEAESELECLVLTRASFQGRALHYRLIPKDSSLVFTLHSVTPSSETVGTLVASTLAGEEFQVQIKLGFSGRDLILQMRRERSLACNVEVKLLTTGGAFLRDSELLPWGFGIP